ncbi:carbohydrate kinase family protein [Methylocystis parvus]|uniref:Carbohydrate kinase family protein n=1 Tax=Methylocystis parvus TaxID=134 RepID=A0A6B8MCT8_9HYPH|nr:PfkB family carbohydrate kinase [Methylocystis parvus]QGM98460.1 carbohydrate kinase family protein [Methylocystis parvus]WBK01202.1 PfkB family carbohydrate kinase [Methylocystis parvus OBBP]
MAGYVCCLGSINFDVAMRLDRLPEPHEKIPANAISVGGGGSAANTAVWLAREGLNARMLGWVGDDLLGAFALRDLAGEGVDVSGVNVLRSPSPVAVCLSPPGDNRIVTSPRLDAPWTPDDALPTAAGADWLHVTVRDAGFLTRARERGARRLSVELNGDYDPAFARAADCLFANHDELARAVGSEDPMRFLLERHAGDPAIWFVTHGDEGAQIMRAGCVETVPTVPVEPVDRTGGGDAFNAGAIAGLLRGAEPAEAARNGLRLATQAITRLGAR